AFDDGGASVGVARLDGPEAPRRLWRGPGGFGYAGPSVAADGATFAIWRSAAREPGDVWLGRVAREGVDWRRLTDFHAGAREKLTAGFEQVRWTAPDGLEIGGPLMRPAGTTGPAPLVVIVHGGPTGMSGDRFQA